MANYVYNRVVCSRVTVEKYFEETRLTVDGAVDQFVTLEKLSTDLPIYYGFGTVIRPLENGQVSLLFATRWYHPIKAIQKALELDTQLVWYTVEENCIYVSRFSCRERVMEETFLLEDEKEWESWYEAHLTFCDELDSADYDVWYFLETIHPFWVEWPTNDRFARYSSNRPSREELDQVIALGRERKAHEH